MTDQHSTSAPHHHLRKMFGRDPTQSHRVATPLELLYDLTVVVAFGIAGSQLAHALAAGHIAVGIIGFAFTMFGVIWAWINYTWFASAFDTDDWFMRVAVLVQMAGVLILGLGIPPFFHGLEDNWQIHNEVLILGYIVMRVALVALWIRAAFSNPIRRQTCLTYAIGILIAQLGWMVVAALHLSLPITVALILVLFVLELGMPYLAETKHTPTPWHPHHIAERYGLLTIIALGEGIIGTTSALEALVAAQGWTMQIAVILAAGLSLTFACWWVYFTASFGELLAKRRESSFTFGYGHIVLYMAIAAIGSGLHVVAYAFESKTILNSTAVLLTVAIPVGLFIYTMYALVYLTKLKTIHTFHYQLLLTTTAVLIIATVLTLIGLHLEWALLIVMLAPWISVIAFELIGYRYSSL